MKKPLEKGIARSDDMRYRKFASLFGDTMRPLRVFAYRACLVLQWLLGFLLLPASALLKARPESVAKWLPDAKWAIEAYHDNAWLILFLLAAFTQAFRFLAPKIKPVWPSSAMHELLKQAYRFAFKKGPREEPPHLHRVTLFEKKRKKLIIRARSCHLTNTSQTTFAISDNPEECEGVAGWTYVLGQILFIDGLPELGQNATADDFEMYAAKTYVSSKWLQEKRPKARSYLGIPVEVKAKLWGVLVLDSAGTQTIRYDALSGDQASLRDREAYNFMGIAVGKLLERITQ